MMRALAYLLSARALEVGDAERGIRWPKPDLQLPPLAPTEETAAAWRRWRDQAPADRAPVDGPKNLGTVTPALKPSGI
jgi:hypothetical protein